jgi:hypothetical protein
MDEPQSPLDLLNGALQIFGGLYLLKKLFQHLPKSISIPNTLIWALVCSIVSGTGWAALVRYGRQLRVFENSTGIFGGIGKEPSTVLESCVFALVMFVPLTLVATYLERRSGSTVPTAAPMGFIFGVMLGSSLFYAGHVRDRVLAHHYSHAIREVQIAWMWVGLLAIFGFAGYEIGHGIVLGFRRMLLARFVTRVFAMSLTVALPVSGFVMLLPSDEFEMVRGMWAGGFLLLGALGALLLTEPVELFHWVKELVE